MLPVNYGGHAAYQDTFVSRFLDLFPDPFSVPKQTWDIIVKFWYLDLSETDTIMQGFKTPCDTESAAAKLLPLMQRINLPNNNPFCLIFRLYQAQFLDVSVRKGLVTLGHLSLAGDGTPLETARLERSKKICGCPKGPGCGCKRKFSQPDCNWGWDSSRNKYFFGYHLYMFVAADSENDLPVFPMLGCASRHGMLSFLHTFFSMKSYLPEFHIEKPLLDSAHMTLTRFMDIAKQTA